MSWLIGGAQLARRRWFEQVGPITGPLAWAPHLASWPPGVPPTPPPPLCSGALTFVLAASRGTVLGSTASWPGHLAARFGALTAWSLLDRSSASSTLSLNPNLKSMKDYLHRSTKGTIGGGFAILEMQVEYPWFGHWEEAFCFPGIKGPDYVFGKPGILAAVEAKCTEQADPYLAQLLKKAWREQVRDSGAWGMDEGWVIAACFDAPLGAALELAFGTFPPPAAVAGAAVAPVAGAPPMLMTFFDAVHCVVHGMLKWIWRVASQTNAAIQAPRMFVREVIAPQIDSVLRLQANANGNELLGEPISFPTEGGRMLSMTPLCRLDVLIALANTLGDAGPAIWPEPIILAGEAVTSGAAFINGDAASVDVWLRDGTGARFTWTDGLTVRASARRK